MFKEWKAQVENEANERIKRLRTDRGGEFNSNLFDSYCMEHGIFKQLTTAHTPQQNGVAERKNQTLVEAARSMLKDANLGSKFWAEAVHTAAYL